MEKGNSGSGRAWPRMEEEAVVRVTPFHNQQLADTQ